MRSRTTRSFRKAFSGLPPEAQEQARRAFQLFSEDPHHPSLRFRRVHAREPIYSARVSLQVRALAVRSGDWWVWFWIGSHADYDQLLGRGSGIHLPAQRTQPSQESERWRSAKRGNG
ncbi:MAG: hypothetical protein WD960_08455 [Gemmatimonadota bacterium]